MKTDIQLMYLKNAVSKRVQHYFYDNLGLVKIKSLINKLLFYLTVKSRRT